jgi:hypothetical protein
VVLIQSECVVNDFFRKNKNSKSNDAFDSHINFFSIRGINSKFAPKFPTLARTRLKTKETNPFALKVHRKTENGRQIPKITRKCDRQKL